MKSSRYTEEQTVGILKQRQAGLGAKELCRKYGIDDAEFYKWRSKYGGMEASDACKLRALEEENQPQELLTPRARRAALSWAIKDKGNTQCLAGWWARSRRRTAMPRSDQTTIHCGSGWRNWLRNVGGFAIRGRKVLVLTLYPRARCQANVRSTESATENAGLKSNA
jgi:putative transposase